MSYDHARAVQTVLETTVGPRADEVDRSGNFPREGVEALASAGLLGLLSAQDVGGRGEGLDAAAHVVERIGGVCGSTAMVLLMHYAATAVIEAQGPKEVRQAVARDEHLSTLAFSEAGSRSHFWAPLGTAAAEGDLFRLDARKSWVTSAGEADSYVWSSLPVEGDGPMTLWLVPRDAAGLRVQGRYDGFGLRGNASTPVTAEGVAVRRDRMLGADGAGLDIALRTALPTFLVLNASFSLGLMEALAAKAREHLTGTRLEHLGRSPADEPVHRARFAELRIRTDQVRAFLRDALAALAQEREDAMLRVLQVKAVAAEAACEVADATMRLCGGTAFRKETGVERLFRDSLAARVMAPTTPALHEFVGRVSLGMALFPGGDS